MKNGLFTLVFVALAGATLAQEIHFTQKDVLDIQESATPEAICADADFRAMLGISETDCINEAKALITTGPCSRHIPKGGADAKDMENISTNIANCVVNEMVSKHKKEIHYTRNDVLDNLTPSIAQGICSEGDFRAMLGISEADCIQEAKALITTGPCSKHISQDGADAKDLENISANIAKCVVNEMVAKHKRTATVNIDQILETTCSDIVTTCMGISKADCIDEARALMTSGPCAKYLPQDGGNTENIRDSAANLGKCVAKELSANHKKAMLKNKDTAACQSLLQE